MGHDGAIHRGIHLLSWDKFTAHQDNFWRYGFKGFDIF